MALFWAFGPCAYVESLRQGEQQKRPPQKYRIVEDSMTTDMILINFMHKKEELGWRRVAKRPTEEAGRVRRLKQLK